MPSGSSATPDRGSSVESVDDESIRVWPPSSVPITGFSASPLVTTGVGSDVPCPFVSTQVTRTDSLCPRSRGQTV